MFQLIPEITSLTPITTALPLFGVLSLTAIKYAYDDVVSAVILVKTPLIMSVRHELLAPFQVSTELHLSN